MSGISLLSLPTPQTMHLAEANVKSRLSVTYSFQNVPLILYSLFQTHSITVYLWDDTM